MARKSLKKSNTNVSVNIDVNQLLSQEVVVNNELSDEISNAMLNYAVEVICDRAIPRIEDGLKPVQRRILWASWEKKYLFNAPFVKCAKIVGDVIATYHPHGTSCVRAM